MECECRLSHLILTNFLQKICHLSIAKQKINLETIIDQIKEKIGDKKLNRQHCEKRVDFNAVKGLY